MVLSLMRKHAKSWLIKFLIAIIALVFIFYFGYSFNQERVVKIAYVNGEVITGMEYEKLYRELLATVRRQYKDLLNDNLLKTMDLKNRALENLITQKLISQEARQLGLEVTEEEIQESIMQYPAFQINGRFDLRRYQALLANNRMKPEDFEEDMAGNLLQEKLRQLIFVFMGVTDQEALDNYTYANQQVDLGFVRFSPDDYPQPVDADAAAIKAFFEENREDYRIPDKIKLSYVEIDPAGFKALAKVADNDIQAYYEYNISAFSSPKQVKARHILFMVEEGVSEDKERGVRDKAKAVLEEARQGKDFAELAKTYSEGPTKTKGGDLGYFSEGNMVKSFEEAAFKLKAGEISGLVRTPFGYHIIKVEDVKEAGTKQLEEVKEEILDKVTSEACMDLAHEKGLSLVDQMPYELDLALFASEHDLETKSTEYISEQDAIPGIGGDQRFLEALFALEPKETSELIELDGKFYIFQVLDKKESYLPEMDEVLEKVKTDFATHMRKQTAKAAAEAYLSELRQGKDWAKLAEERKLKIEETGFFTRRRGAPKTGNMPDLVDAAFRLAEGSPYPDSVFENDSGIYVIRWKETKPIDKKEFEAAKDAFRYSVLVEKQRRAFQNWIDALRKRAEIEIVSPVS
ncbi:MAG: SurA N-terminal domain-containing protein [Deltaproteobacteria bacterium]|nr:SurA N-terminal domain-containing protein [Deltaproteobacteria bacterium]MBW1819068.1 SurA N-terminal domain-containing protein [Deltaproteobacteria bacterium]